MNYGCKVAQNDEIKIVSYMQETANLYNICYERVRDIYIYFFSNRSDISIYYQNHGFGCLKRVFLDNLFILFI